MRKLIKLTIVAAMVLGISAAVSTRRGSFARQQLPQNYARAILEQERSIKMSITTGGSLFGPPKNLYHVGQRVPVSIMMENTSDQPVQVCISGTLYQDRPTLLKDDQAVPYLELQSELLKASQEDKTCLKDDVPEQVILQPQETKVVDWFILAEGHTPMGDMAWYEPLQAGKYELSIQRHLGCCDGPMLESNKISFEVVP